MRPLKLLNIHGTHNNHGLFGASLGWREGCITILVRSNQNRIYVNTWLIKGYIKKIIGNQSTTNGPINAHMTIAKV